MKVIWKHNSIQLQTSNISNVSNFEALLQTNLGLITMHMEAQIDIFQYYEQTVLQELLSYFLIQLHANILYNSM